MSSQLEKVKKMVNSISLYSDVQVKVMYAVKEIAPKDGYKVFEKIEDKKTIVIDINGGANVQNSR